MRADGKRVRNEDPMYQLIPYFLSKRYDSMNMLTLDVPEQPIREYMNKKRKEGISVSHLAVVLTTYLRAVEKYPALNRFIMGHRIYQRNEITVSMAVLKAGGGGEDTMTKIHLTPGNTVIDVQKKIDECIETNRAAGENNNLDKAMRILTKIPLLPDVGIGILKLMDRCNLFPKAFVEMSPFHASLLITNLASIRTNHMYHHLYEFGTTGMAIAMGNLREVPKRGADGVIFERCIPMGVVMDERVANGHYFAQAFALMKKYYANPALLETAPEL